MRQREQRRNSASYAESKQEQLQKEQLTEPEQPLEHQISKEKSTQLTRGRRNGQGGEDKPGRKKEGLCSGKSSSNRSGQPVRSSSHQ